MNREVCKWILLISGNFRTSCDNFPEIYPEDGLCPYCGNKIEIVEDEDG